MIGECKHGVTTTGEAMSETIEGDVETAGPVPPVHDHAWRRVAPDEDSPGRLGHYRCDVCSTAWSL